MADIDLLIGKVAERNGIRLDKDDPVFAIVTLNELVLREATRDLHAQIQTTINGFDDSVGRLDARAGAVIAQAVRQSAAEIRNELQKDLASANLQVRQLVSEVNAAHARPVALRWMALGIVCGLLLFVCGVLVGRWSNGGI